MTTIINDELFEEIMGRISHHDVRDDIEYQAYEIALASLAAAPALYMNRFTGKTFTLDEQPGADTEPNIYIPLYAAQPAPVLPDKLPREYINGWPLAHSDYAEGWNDCRDAMLHGADGKPELTVWYGAMPETNGKTNWTAILHRKGQQIWEGITIDRSEYPDRVRYEADRMRHLIGELPDEPDILSYDADAHSGYVKPGNSPVTSDGWVKCSDAVPAECCDVILHDALGNVFPGSWDRIFCSVRGENKMTFVDSNGTEVENATHWMPMPEIPQMEVNS